MKRSEMIEMLIDIIASENDEGQTANTLMAQSVLNLVEVAGMKPPSTGKKLIFNPFTETTEVSEKYEWEPENGEGPGFKYDDET